jgi:hypothetical protein
MKRTHFAPGQEPELLTPISEECNGGVCESCPRVFKQDEDPGESIFCIHYRHKKCKSWSRNDFASVLIALRIWTLRDALQLFLDQPRQGFLAALESGEFTTRKVS